jgi:hypothetical protein
MREGHDPGGLRLPIKLDTTTNGEFAPIPLAPVHRHARALAHERAGAHAKRSGLTRRGFLVSACGAASTLLAFNDAFAAAGPRGGYFDLPRESALDAQLARSKLDTGEFVFDVQGHFVNPTGAWTRGLPPGAQPLRFFAQNKACPALTQPGLDYLQCLGSDGQLQICCNRRYRYGWHRNAGQRYRYGWYRHNAGCGIGQSATGRYSDFQPWCSRGTD